MRDLVDTSTTNATHTDKAKKLGTCENESTMTTSEQRKKAPQLKTKVNLNLTTTYKTRTPNSKQE